MFKPHCCCSWWRVPTSIQRHVDHGVRSGRSLDSKEASPKESAHNEVQVSGMYQPWLNLRSRTDGATLQGEVWRTLAKDGAATGRSFLEQVKLSSTVVQDETHSMVRALTKADMLQTPSSGDVRAAVYTGRLDSPSMSSVGSARQPSSTPTGIDRHHGSPGVRRALSRLLSSSKLGRTETGTTSVYGDAHPFTDMYAYGMPLVVHR